MTVLPMTDDQARQFQAWRAIALEEMSYFADVMFAVRPVNAPGLGTWAVDRHWRLYIDFEACTRDRTFLWNVESVLHEGSHLWADDATSADEVGVTKAEEKVWNAAADLARNDDLDDAGCKTFRQDRMLPEFIGEENGHTPHHYFAVLQSKMAAKAARTTRPTLRLHPGTFAHGATEDVRVTGTITPAILDPDDFEVTLLLDGSDPDIDPDIDPDGPGDTGTTVGITSARARGAAAVTFEIVGDLPIGQHLVTVKTGTHKVTAPLRIEAPHIALTPQHVASGWTPPLPLTIHGAHTAFDTNSLVTVTDAHDRPVAVTGTTVVSRTEVAFKIAQQVPAGRYSVTVTDRGEDLTCTLDIALPHLDLSPAHLPIDYRAPHPVAVATTDLALSDATHFTVHPMIGPVPLPDAVTGALRNTVVKTSSYASMDLIDLPEGTYLVTATNPPLPDGAPGPTASAVLTISDDPTPDGGSSPSDQPATDPSEEPFKGCGSGSGGQAWDGELPADDDLGGAAPAIGGIEKQAVRLNTAAAIKDFAAKGRGTVPAGLLATAEKILEPSTMPWEQVLGAAFRSSARPRRGHARVDHRRTNRRRSGQMLTTPAGPRAMFVPGRSTPRPVVELIRDTSGSMGDMDVAVITREVERMSKRVGVRGQDLIVTDVDAAVHGSVPFRGRASIAEIKGRGGTSMTVGIKHAWARTRNRASVIVVMTDGGTDWPEQPGPVPVIAALVPPHGISSPEYVKEIASSVPEWIKTVVCEPGKVAPGPAVPQTD